jgi:hypothetical protein
MKSRPFYAALMALSLLPATLPAAGYFEFSPATREAYHLVLSLRLDEGRQALLTARRSEPENLLQLLVENYADFLTVMVNDDKAEYQRLSRQMGPRLEAIARGDARSPYYRYAQAEIRLQRAVLAGRFNAYLAGLSDIKQAYALLEENQRRFPDFIANKKSLGVLHALVGNVPADYRWAVRALGGMSGTIEQGLAEVEEVLTYARHHDFVFREEALVAYAFLQLHLNNQSAAAWKVLQDGGLDHRSNPLAGYALANMAVRVGRTDEAIRLLRESPSGPPYHPFHYRSLLLGMAKLYRLDADADGPLREFIAGFKGGNGLKEAYQKLAWHHLVQGNPGGYHTYINLVRHKGSARSEPDKAALREAKSGELPDARLLRARLLFDGGYYQRAYDLLKNAEADYASNRRLALEYTYRSGRIAHKLGRNAEAIVLYGRTIENGARDPWYYACNAALQLGLLYEALGDRLQARLAFKRCLKIEPDDYAGSLHTKAKAGLNRVD